MPTRAAVVRVRRDLRDLPTWVAWVARICALFVLATVVSLALPVLQRGSRTCGRCSAVESGTRVLGVWLGSERPPTLGRLVFEQVAGPCAQHAYRDTGCWSSSDGRIACSEQRHDAGDLYELCARAGTPDATDLVARLAALSTEEQWRVRHAVPLDSARGPPTREEARRWVERVLAWDGWRRHGAR